MADASHEGKATIEQVANQTNGTNGNGSAATPTPPSSSTPSPVAGVAAVAPPTDDVLRARVEQVAPTIDLAVTSSKKVREQLEKEFGVSLKDKKAFIDGILLSFVKSESNANDGPSPSSSPAAGAKEEKKEKKPKAEKKTKAAKAAPKEKKSSSKKKASKKEASDNDDDNDGDNGDGDAVDEGEDEEPKMASGRPRRAATAKVAAAQEKRAKNRERQEARKASGIKKPPKPMWLSPALQAFLQVEGASRGEVVKMMWDYIHKHNLQDPAKKSNILADEPLKELFGRDKFTM